jgi:predicted enzyme related to lactoylglutathione lyase
VIPKLTYVIEFVADMTRAVAFYRDVVGLPLRSESPHWSEFSTGETTLALHPASQKNPAGTFEIGLGVSDVPAFHQAMLAKGVTFPLPPKQQDWGGLLAQFQDSEGSSVTVSGT